MNTTWIGIGTALILIGLCIFIGTGRNFSTPTPEPLVNPLIVASSTNNTVTEPSTTKPDIVRNTFNKPLVLHKGEQKIFSDGLIMTVTELSDSRCKQDVQCIWAGEVSASLTIVGGSIATSQTIHLGSETKKRITLGNYLFILTDVTENSVTVTVSETSDTAGTTPSVGTITGSVTIGPFCPVEREGVPCETPVEAYTSRSVIVYNETGDKELDSKHLDSQGNFILTLDKGDYQLQIRPAGIGDGEKKLVHLDSGETTNITFTIDTGIR